jgi:hypothetical protein
VDDDCNALVDDGDALASCGAPANGTAACEDGCVIAGCADGWADLNGEFDDGCETMLDTYPEVCGSASNLGTVSDSGSSLTASGTIAPAGDEDWITFTAQDSPDAGTGCDEYHVTIALTDNPGGVFAMEVRRGGCGATAECEDPALTSYDFALDFQGSGDWGSEVRGECPCADPTYGGVNLCSDDTAPYFVRVYRPDGGASADPYTLTVSNNL